MVDVHIFKEMNGFKLQVDLMCDEGKVGILGASGCGKSMTLQCIAGIITPDEGYIAIDGRVFYDSAKKINIPAQNRKCGYLFQNYALFPHMNVLNNIMSGIKDRNKENRRKIAVDYIVRFGLEGLQDHLPFTLSGGQQQRVALARMMASEPSIILLDEPYSALDGYLKEKMQSEFEDLLTDYHGPVFMVSHSRDEIYRFSDRIAVMSDGKQIECDVAHEIYHNPKNVETARLTGCINIARVEKYGKHEVYIPSWDITISTAGEVTEDIRYIGIRSHDLIEGNRKDQNTYLMQLVTENHAPFEYKYGVGTERCNHQDRESIIWWKESKNLESFQNQRKFPCYVTLSPEKILLLKD